MLVQWARYWAFFSASLAVLKSECRQVCVPSEGSREESISLPILASKDGLVHVHLPSSKASQVFSCCMLLTYSSASLFHIQRLL